MKFDAKMARTVAECYNKIDDNWGLIIPKLFACARNGVFEYSTSFDSFGKDRYKKIVQCQNKLRQLGFEVEIDEDMKTAWISW